MNQNANIGRVRRAAAVVATASFLVGSVSLTLPARSDSNFSTPPVTLNTLQYANEIALDGDGSHALVVEADYPDSNPGNWSGSLSLVVNGVSTALDSAGPWSHPHLSPDGLRGYALDANATLFELTDSDADGEVDLLTDITPLWDDDGDGGTPEVPLGVYAIALNSDATKMLIDTDVLQLGLLVGTRSGSSWIFNPVSAYPTIANLSYITMLDLSGDATVLYATTDLGEVVKSADGGTTWTQILAPKSSSGENGLSVSDDGQVIGHVFSEYNAPAVQEALFSVDGGATWSDLYSPTLGLDIRDLSQFLPLPMKSVVVSSDGTHMAFGMMGNPTLIFNENLLVSPNDWELVGTESQGFIDIELSGDKTRYGMVLFDGVGPEVRTQSTAVTTFNGAWAPSSFPGSGQQSFAIIDGETSDYVPSHVTVTYFDNVNFTRDSHLCDTVNDDFGISADVLGAALPGGADPALYPCSADRLLTAFIADPASVSVSGRAILEPCPADPTANDASVRASKLCIEGISLGTSSLSPASFNRLTTGPSFIGEDGPEGLGKYPGGRVSLWASSVLNSAGTGTYAANVAAILEPIFLDSDDDGTVDTFSGLTYAGISGTVTPYVETGNYGSLTLTDLTVEEMTIGGSQVVSWSGGDGPRCAFAENNVCGRIVDFAAGTKVQLDIRVPKTIGGFFKGRMKSPEILVTEIDSETQKISASAEFVSVPRIEHTAETTFLDTQLSVALASDPNSTLGSSFLIDNDGSNATGNLRGSSFASSPLAFDLVDWLKGASLANDRVSGFNTLWSLGTVGTQADPTDPSLSCLADTTKVLGVVTSNAMVYQDSPPTLGVDSEGNTILEYKVAGMHLEPTGSTPVQGTYDMLLDSTVARCLYPSLASVPQGQLSADISVSEGVTEKASTVSVSEAGGWVSLSAYGFTFSTNTVQVSLKQAATPPEGGSAAPVIAPVTMAPEIVTPPTIPAGESGAVLIGGQPANVTIAPSSTKSSLEIKGTDWSLNISPSTTNDALNAEGQLVLNPQLTTDISGAGFQANSKASAYLIPSGASQVAALGVTQAGLRAKTTGTINLGEISVSSTGTFTANLDLSSASPGSYVLQINGAAPDGKIRSISVKANVPDTALKGWTKKISENQVKVYVKNVVRAGKVQIFVNGEELAWINAGDESDRKLRFAQGFNYLVRTVNLEPGKNRIEIRLDGERIRFNTYTLG